MPGPDALFLFQLWPPAAPLSPAKEDKKSEVIIAPFKEKPITGRGEPSSVFTYTPWSRTELRALGTEFHDPSHDLLGFAQEFELTIQTYKPRFSDLYQLIQLLVSESKAGEWKEKTGWKRPLMEFESNSPEAHTECKELAQKLLELIPELFPKNP